VSAAGIVVFHSFCTCTGSDHYSLYVTPEKCTESYHVHHKHGYNGEEESATAEECHECNSHEDDCGCNDPGIKLYQLDDRVLNGNPRSVMQPVPVTVLNDLLPALLSSSGDADPPQVLFCESPPGIQRSLDFLILIQQLKIPELS
jgi:hypothetical protein